MQHNLFFAGSLTALLLLILSGCSNPDSKYSMVEGTVTFNGQPLSEATVSFQPVSSEGEAASGLTDASGKFTLTSAGATGGGRGALPGEYKVTVKKLEVAPPDPDEAAHARGEISYDELQSRISAKGTYGQKVAPSKSLLPAKYGLPSSTDLKATVQAGKNAPFTFELTD